MANQTAKGFVISTKVESTINTLPSPVTGGTQIRFNGGSGFSMKTALIKSGEARSDGQKSQSRLGSQSVPGQYVSEMTVGGHDPLYEALMRATFVAPVVITQATAGLTSIATPTSSTIVATAGSWITAGVRVGDVVRLTNFNTSANNNINLRVKTVTALTLTVFGTPLTVDAANDTTFTLTISKKLSNPSTPVRRTFWVDEWNREIDQSQTFGGVRWTGMKIIGTPDGMAMVEFTGLGVAELETATGAASPTLTSPTLNTNISLVFADATMNWGGTDITRATAFELNYVITAKTEPVLGGRVSPDVFDNDCDLSGSISMIRTDLLNASARIAEQEFELHVMLVEPESEPKDFISIYVPRVKLTDVTKTLGGDGALIEQMPFTCGKKEGAGANGYDDTMMTLCTSAP